MRARLRTASLLIGPLFAATLLAGCAGDSWDEPHAPPSAVGALRDGFEPSTAPSPEATIAPDPGSWGDVHPSTGYRVVLLSAGTALPTRTLVAAVKDWAAEEEVDLRTVAASGDYIDGIEKAMGLKPDLIIGTGNDIIDALTTVTPSHLGQQFLVVGAELPEPTANVTAVDWAGASFRGNGLGMSSTFDAASFTPERCADAVRAGVAAVLNDLTGIVIWIG